MRYSGLWPAFASGLSPVPPRSPQCHHLRQGQIVRDSERRKPVPDAPLRFLDLFKTPSTHIDAMNGEAVTSH